MKMYLCTRPQLAALLQSNGHTARPTVNPWKPNLNAWLFPLNKEAAEIIDTYYKGISKETPANVREMLDEN